jgi:hypothetical protein
VKHPFLLTLFALLISYLIILPRISSPVRAACYKSTELSYLTCLAGVLSGSSQCVDGSITYCCTNQPVPDACPPSTVPPHLDPNCGALGQICCASMGGCDTPNLVCFTTGRAGAVPTCVESSSVPGLHTPQNDKAFCQFNPAGGVWTALGCLPVTDATAFISVLTGWALSISGGILLLLLIYSGFNIATAAGDPKKVAAGREMFSSALLGILLIILSVVMLNFLGVNVLHLPGF